MLQMDITFCLFSGDMVFMSTKINLHQYVVFFKPQNFDTADIKGFTVWSFDI